MRKILNKEEEKGRQSEWKEWGKKVFVRVVHGSAKRRSEKGSLER